MNKRINEHGKCYSMGTSRQSGQNVDHTSVSPSENYRQVIKHNCQATIKRIYQSKGTCLRIKAKGIIVFFRKLKIKYFVYIQNIKFHKT